jgi:hypothetical protein
MTGEKVPPEEQRPPAGPAPEEPQPLGFIGDVVRKAVLTGVGALFLTEEGARKLAREWKLPKELASYLVAQASGAKDEVLRVVGSEIRRFFESDALKRELSRLLSHTSIEVTAQIRFKEASPRAKPGITATVKPRFRRRGEKDAGDKGGGEGS